MLPEQNRNKNGYYHQQSVEASVEQRQRGARRQQVAVLSFGYLKDLQQKMAREALSRMLRSPMASLLNSLMIAVAFALPALFYLMVVNLQALGGHWDGRPQISVYLDSDLNQRAISQLVRDARSDPDIEEAIYISPNKGLENFREKSGIGDIVSELGFNPLPGVVVLTPSSGKNSRELDTLAGIYRKKPSVDQVQLDLQWVQRLNTILELLERVVLSLGVLLGVTVLLVISNTIRLNIESRKDEIRIVKMVGGTDGFIILPFLYMGAWYGLVGAIFAQILIISVVAAVSDQVLELAGLYNSGINAQKGGFSMLATLVVSGVALGIMGAGISCYRHLRTLVPK